MKTKHVMITLLLLVPFLRSYPQNARQIMEKAYNAIEFGSSEMVTTLIINDGKGNTRVRQVANATKKFGETTKTMIRFLSPADVKGTTMLIYDYENKDDELWIYLPALRKSRRIISSEKGKSFMGSEFANADMTKPNLNDFSYILSGSETMDGSECWIIESTCLSEEAKKNYGFSRKVSWIDKTNFRTLKTEYYTPGGIREKIMTLQDYRKQNNGKYFAYNMKMENLVNQRHSEIIIDKFQLGSGLGEENFSVATLGN